MSLNLKKSIVTQISPVLNIIQDELVNLLAASNRYKIKEIIKE